MSDDGTGVKLYSPEIVTGHVMVFNVAEDPFSPKHGSTRFELLESRLNSLSGRRAPSWTTGAVGDVVLVKMDFSQDAFVLSTSQPFEGSSKIWRSRLEHGIRTPYITPEFLSDDRHR